VFGRGVIERVGQLASGLDFHRTLLVADRGVLPGGHVARAGKAPAAAGAVGGAVPYHDFGETPDSDMNGAGCRFAEPLQVDSIAALGGGSSLDCAKGINFVLTNGGDT